MWDNLLPDEAQKAMGEIVTHLIFDMFQLNSQVISDHYGGEKKWEIVPLKPEEIKKNIDNYFEKLESLEK